MDNRDKLRQTSQDRLREAEARLHRLGEVIERRARLGFDTSEGWRLFRLTATSLATMRQTEALIEALQHQAGNARSGRNTHSGLAASSADRISFVAGEVIQTPEPQTPHCYVIET